MLPPEGDVSPGESGEEYFLHLCAVYSSSVFCFVF